MSDSKAEMDVKRHICTKCGWSGPETDLRAEGALKFCPRCPYMTREMPPPLLAWQVAQDEKTATPKEI